jgi:transmembrane sensor
MNIEPNDTRSRLFDEAGAWLVRVRENPHSAEVRAAFDAWRDAAPEHDQAWSELCRVWSLAGKAEAHYRPLVPTRPTYLRPPVLTARRFATGLAFACALAGAAWLGTPSLVTRLTADYVTATAEIKTISLDDGSTVELAPDSALDVQFQDDTRQVTLLRGEAFFDITKDPNRSFRVLAGGAQVEVLGTAFDVEITDTATQVSVARGSVTARADNTPTQPADSPLKPGDAVSIDRQSGDTVKTTVSTDDVGAWRQGRLVVRNASVASVIDVIRRYDSAWITLADTTLGEKKVTGIYDLRAPALALGALVDPFGGKVTSFGGTARVITRQ